MLKKKKTLVGILACKTCPYRKRVEQTRKKSRERWHKKYAKTDRRVIESKLKI